MFLFVPLEIILEIAKCDLSSWFALTRIPLFGRWTLTKEGHNTALAIIKLHIEIMPIFNPFQKKFETTYKFRGEHHSLFGIPVSFQSKKYEWYKRGKLHRADGPAVIQKIDRKQARYACTWYEEGNVIDVCILPTQELPDFHKIKWSNQASLERIAHLAWKSWMKSMR